MGRMACVDVPALPLQLFQRSRPDLAGRPAAIVEREAPSGTIVWANAAARAAGVRSGLRYAAALALCSSLAARAIDSAEIERAVDELVLLLRRFTPHVEPCAEEAGVLWLDATGLERIHPSLASWAASIRACLHEHGFTSAIAVGFRRFGTYACAKGALGRECIVLGDPSEETSRARNVPLSRVGLAFDVCRELERIGVRRVGDFVRLASGGVLQRFGRDAHRLHRLASGDLETPLEPRAIEAPLRASQDLEHAEHDRERLIALVDDLVQPLLAILEDQGEAASAILLSFTSENGAVREELLTPSEPTLDASWVSRLVRLRLESIAIEHKIERIDVVLERARRNARQQRLFVERPRRDPAAASKAFAALRAAFGEDVVVRASLRDAHLPQVCFAWERIDRIAAPKPRAFLDPPLVRRILAAPEMLPARERREPDGWLLRGLAEGPVRVLSGPFPISTGWWNRETSRDEHYAEMENGDVHWIYYDRERRTWFRQGSVS